MIPPSIPDDEFERLMALHRLALLDTPPTESLDRITLLAAGILEVPILLVSLVDSNRQWFKSCVGLSVLQTPRDISFCGHVVFERRPLVIRDATADLRFADNPLVTGPPMIRAYLGIPLFAADGQPIGTLCAIDTRSRDFSQEQVEILTAFAKIVEEDIHAKAVMAETKSVLEFARSRDRLFRDTFELGSIGMLHIGTTGRLIRVNGHACEMLGHLPDAMRAMGLLDIVHPDEMADTDSLLRGMLAGRESRRCEAKRFKRSDGQILHGRWTVEMKADGLGKPDYAIAILETEPTHARPAAPV